MQLFAIILWGLCACNFFCRSRMSRRLFVILWMFFFQTSHYNVYLIAILSFLPPRFCSLSQWIFGSKVVIASILYLFIFFSTFFVFHSVLVTFRSCNFCTKLLSSGDIWFKPSFPGHYKYLLFCSSAKDYIWVWSIFRKQTIDYLAQRVSKENCRCRCRKL